MAKKNAQVEEVLVSETAENQVENVATATSENPETANNTSQAETESADDTAKRIAEHEAKEKLAIAVAAELAETLKADIGRRIKVVPFNTIQWVDGTIVGIVNDKRSHKVLYAIKLDDGRRIVKAHDSELIQKSEETVVIVKNARTASKTVKLTAEEFEAAEAAAAQLVGTTVLYIPFKAETETKIEGKITSIVPDDRSGRILLKIESVIETPVEGGEPIKEVKVSHKVSTSPDIEFTETVDLEMKDAFLKRREVRMAKLVLTPEQKVKNAEEAVAKAELAIKTATENLAKRKAELEAAVEEFLKADAPDAVAEEDKENIVYDADAESEEETESEETEDDLS